MSAPGDARTLASGPLADKISTRVKALKDPNLTMKSSGSSSPVVSDGAGTSPSPQPPVQAPGRPSEIEGVTNVWLIHPISRRVVDVLAQTPITPNQVSVASVFFAAADFGGLAVVMGSGQGRLIAD